MNIRNPKFNFNEEQTQNILQSAYHLSEASKHLMDINGMMALMINSMAIELMDQAGLTEDILDKIDASRKYKNELNIELTDSEKRQVDDIFNLLEE